MQEASLNDAWGTLRRAGVPLGHAALDAKAPTLDDVHAALARVVTVTMTTGERDALAAWLGALRRHWPTRYRSIAGELGSRLEELIDGAEPDRYLKLRRIAAAHLAQW